MALQRHDLLVADQSGDTVAKERFGMSDSGKKSGSFPITAPFHLTFYISGSAGNLLELAS